MFCRQCSYPLNGLDRQRCPECGRAFSEADKRTYCKTTRRQRWLLRLRLLGIGFVVVVLLHFATGVEMRREMPWVDAVTGSTKEQTRWYVFDYETTPVIQRSALEAWLADREGSMRHDWRNVAGTGKNILGRPMSRAHGRAPPVYALATKHEVIEVFVNNASVDEVAEFVRIMRMGSEDEQHAAVDRVFDRYWNWLDDQSGR